MKNITFLILQGSVFFLFYHFVCTLHYAYPTLISQKEQRLHKAYGEDSGSRKKPFRVASLKKNPTDHPVSVSQPSVTNYIVRRNSSGRREPLRRNSSGKSDSSSSVPRVASMLKRTISSSGDTMTSNSPSVKSPPASSQSQNTSQSSLLYRSRLFPSTNSDHTSMLQNEVITPGNTNLFYKSPSQDTPREVRLSCPNEVIDEHNNLESNEETEEPPTYIHVESNGEIEKTPRSMLLESNEEPEELLTPIPLNLPVASPRKRTAINTASPVSDLPPFFSTLQTPSPPQSHPPSPPILRKNSEEAKDLTEESPEPSPLAYKVHFLKVNLNYRVYLFSVIFSVKLMFSV